MGRNDNTPINFDSIEFKKYFAEFIKGRLLLSEKSLQQLADQSKISLKTLKRYLYGDANKSPRIQRRTFHEILRALHVNVDQFLAEYTRSAPPAEQTNACDSKPKPYAYALGLVISLSLIVLSAAIVLPNKRTLPSVIVSGKVLDAHRIPIADARVRISANGGSTRSRSTGEFLFNLRNVKQGSIVALVISHPRFRSYRADLIIRNPEKKLDVVLESAGLP